ncbi:MAG: polysaccharide deacetylase family protein [Reichenbachiella sp.]|uniref:polysaccharide deacetylase family protein n=1 Tax=Reichenbachiella sp. TaxID=2184521 RepID=UPI003267C03D
MKRILKNMLSTSLPLRISKGNRFVFVLHEVSDQIPNPYAPDYSTSIALFRKQIDLLSELFDIISLDRLVSDSELDPTKNYAALTFDDGYMGVFENARPILKSQNIPYAVFFNKSAVESNQLWVSNAELSVDNVEYIAGLLKAAKCSLKDDQDAIRHIVANGSFDDQFLTASKLPPQQNKIYMGVEEIQQLVSDQVLIGNHSSDHLVLSRCSDPGLLHSQIKESQVFLNGITKKEISHFAIPFGHKTDYNEATIAEALASGHKYIYTTNPNRLKLKKLTKKPFLIPRIGIDNRSLKEILFYINRTLIKNYDL